MESGAPFARLTNDSGGRPSGGPAAGGHAPRAALDVGGGAEAGGGRLHGRRPSRKDLRGQYGVGERRVGERVAQQRAAGELVARSTEDRVCVGLEHAPHWEAPMQHLGQARGQVRLGRG